MLSPTGILIVGLVIQCIVISRTIKQIIKPKLSKVETPPRFVVKQFFIEKDRTWVWTVYDTQHNDFARSSGYFKTFQHESDAATAAKLYERTGGPVQ